MKEFIFYIRHQGTHEGQLSSEKEQEFLRKCEDYITKLQRQGKLIAAQPVADAGKIIFKKQGNWQELPVDTTSELNVGYYRIYAKDLAEAITIAKENPEFDYRPLASIEIRELKESESTTGYLYPKEGFK
jgi:hypothetical protein